MKMTSLSSPRKSNLPTNRKLERFLRSPAREETALREALVGQNTIQAVKIIAAEFERRFAGKGGLAKDAIQMLQPEGKAVSWTRLDAHICLLCKRFYSIANILEKQRKFLTEEGKDMLEMQYRYIDFFDKVRFILYSLPRRKDYKLPEEAKDYSTASDKAGGFKTCFLCWRSVPRTKKEKRTALCYVHDMPSTSKEYRRRKNMRKQMLKIFAELEAIVPTLADIRQKHALHPRDFYLRELRIWNDYFPALAKHLRKVNPYAANSPDDLMRALEHPIPFNKLTDMEKMAWEFHFKDFGAYFEL